MTDRNATGCCGLRGTAVPVIRMTELDGSGNSSIRLLMGRLGTITRWTSTSDWRSTTLDIAVADFQYHDRDRLPSP